MKKITSILISLGISIGLSLGIVSTVSATDIKKIYGVEHKYKPNVLAESILNQNNINKTLVEPYLQNIENRKSPDKSQILKPSLLKVWIIADDQKGYKIYFNQDTKKFGLAKYEQGEIPYTSNSSFVPNELTRVFLARK